MFHRPGIFDPALTIQYIKMRHDKPFLIILCSSRGIELYLRQLTLICCESVVRGIKVRQISWLSKQSSPILCFGDISCLFIFGSSILLHFDFCIHNITRNVKMVVLLHGILKIAKLSFITKLETKEGWRTKFARIICRIKLPQSTLVVNVFCCR